MVTPPVLTAVSPALAADDPARWPLALAASTCLLLAAIGAHAGAALLTYSPTKLARCARERRGAAEGDAEPDVVTHLQARDREYASLGWGLALVGVAVALPLLAISRAGLSWPLLCAGALFAMVFCAAVPVALAGTRAERVVLITLPLLRALHWLLRYPVLLPVVGATRWLLRVLRVSDPPPTPDDITDDIMAAVTDSAGGSALPEEERNWIENIVEIKDLTVGEAMTPRTDIVAFEASLDLETAVRKAIEAGHSRYPVYEDKIDRVVGVFYARDALARLSTGDKDVTVRDLMRKPLFVPESMGVSELLRRFKAGKLQMAIVLDEYGGTAGLISVEDILEEIVGDLQDEFDEDDAPIIVSEDHRRIEISGRARVGEVNEILGCEIPENPDYDTVAGYIFAMLGKIPKQGTIIELGNLEFTILGSDDRRIHRMRVSIVEPMTSKSET
jgi:CBS domain containing-hemolysin-like protein